MKDSPYLRHEGYFKFRILPYTECFFVNPNGKLYFELELEVERRLDRDDAGESNMKHIRYQQYLTTAKANEILTKTLNSCFGFDGDFQKLYDGTYNYSDMIVTGNVKAEEYTDKKGESKTIFKIGFINPYKKRENTPEESNNIASQMAALTTQAKQVLENQKPPDLADDDDKNAPMPEPPPDDWESNMEQEQGGFPFP